MCDPVTLGYVAVAAGGVSAIGQMQAANANVEIAKQQQEQLEAEAENVRVVGAQEAGRSIQETQQIAARNRAQFGASGIDPGTGTAGLISEQAAETGSLDAMNILTNAQREAFGLQTTGENIVSQAKSNRRAARFGAASTVLGGVSQAGSLF